MPCNANYLDPNNREKEISKVACLLDELNGIPMNKLNWNGFHPRVYCQDFNADILVAELCSKLSKLNVKDYSLEMQIWWRDHQEADSLREKKDNGN